jgi:hypothetical protein
MDEADVSGHCRSRLARTSGAAVNLALSPAFLSLHNTILFVCDVSGQPACHN